MTAPRSWDVFCRVIDNYGDAAVCWRLARALAALDSQPSVRLWIDHLEPLRALLPQLRGDCERQRHAGVEIIESSEASAFGAPAQVAVDAFGGGLPEAYAQAMAQACERGSRSLWIVLEYLSAEPWVASHHGLPSPHPRLPLERYFFFPGIQAGGLLRESGLDKSREAFLRDPDRRAALWREAGFEPAECGSFTAPKLVTLFGYQNAPVAELLETWSRGPERILAAVPSSRLEPAVAIYMGASDTATLAGRALQRGALEVRFLPFLAQDRYDQLLWSADWNFVRGEDSFVRAQWAERPLTWQLYPQEGGAQLAKLEAFLELYCQGLEPALAEPLRTLWRAWNGAAPRSALAPAWAALVQHDRELKNHAREWSVRAAAAGDLSMNLARFCTERL